MAYNVILSADVSTGLDVDDWFDTYTYLQHTNITKLGIICELYATDTEKALAEELVTKVNNGACTVKKGLLVANKDWGCTGGSCGFCTANEGVAYLLSTLAALGTGQTTRIICTGNYTTVAAAHRCNSALFESKVEYIYIVAGAIGNDGSTNFDYDQDSAQYITNSAVPKIWLAASGQYLPSIQQNQIFSKYNTVSNFLRDRVDAWRVERGWKFLIESGQLPLQGKNIYSVPAFVDLADANTGIATYQTGVMSYNTGTNELEWAAGGSNRDKMLLTCDDVAAVDWMVSQYMVDMRRYSSLGYTP